MIAKEKSLKKCITYLIVSEYIKNTGHETAFLECFKHSILEKRMVVRFVDHPGFQEHRSGLA